MSAPHRQSPPPIEVLYRAHAKVVHGIALAHVGWPDADDVVQECFLRIQRGIESVRDSEAIGAWVAQVARNAARDWLRRRRRRKETVEVNEELAAPADSPSELGDRLLGFLAELPEAYRETLALRLVEGLGGEEIAARTGLTPGSVRVNLCRGMAMLRTKVAEAGWP
jgi:RNA polymerase sigma-70 factor (ECF subfamily)